MGEETRKRKRYFKVHLLDEELEILNAKADEAGISKSEYVRNVILFGAAHKRTVFSDEKSSELIYEVNRIGNNINQIAVRINSVDTIDNRDLENMIHDFRELLGAYDDFVRGEENGDY